MNRRGFLRALGVATAAGATAQAEMIDYMLRQPVSVSGLVERPYDGITITAGDWEFDSQARIIRWVGPEGGQNTMLDLYRACKEAFEHPEMMTEPMPMTRYTNELFELGEAYRISVAKSMVLKDGTLALKHDNSLYMSGCTLENVGFDVDKGAGFEMSGVMSSFGDHSVVDTMLRMGATGRLA